MGKIAIKSVFFALVCPAQTGTSSPWRQFFSTPGYTHCSFTLGHTAAIWAVSLSLTCKSRSAVSHQNCLGHILAHQSLKLKMLTQKYTDGYRRKMETLQNICGACSKLCLAEPFLLGRACKSPWGNPGYIVLVGGEGNAIRAAKSYLL